MNKVRLTLGLFLFQINMSYAGWVSGGGQVVRDGNNPWFLENTQVVKYCITSSKEFSNLPTPVENLVEQSLKYWKEEFNYSLRHSPGFEFGKIKIATQTFFKVDCDENPDLALQFGVLNELQEQFLGDPKKFIGIAVRTDYDEVNLKAKGFIYFSPDSGPLRYLGEHLKDNAWHLGYGGYLKRLVIHELGHVFGISHTEDGRIMAEGYPEELIRKPLDNFPDIWNTGLSMEGFFKYKNSLNFSNLCGLIIVTDEKPKKQAQNLTDEHKFLGLTKEPSCVFFDNLNYRQKFVAKVHYELNDPLVPIGEFNIDYSKTIAWPARSNEVVKLRLNPKQTVFHYSGDPHDLLPVAIRVVEVYGGSYHTYDGKIRKPIRANVSPSKIEIFGAYHDKVLKVY